jgi:hypothetical protein
MRIFTVKVAETEHSTSLALFIIGAESRACRSPRGAWDHLRRALCSWALCVEHCRKKGIPMHRGLEVAEEIYGGPKKRQAWALGCSCIPN